MARSCGVFVSPAAWSAPWAWTSRPLRDLRGKREVVVVGIEDYRKISAREQDLVSFLRSSPLVGVDLQIERDDDPGRSGR